MGDEAVRVLIIGGQPEERESWKSLLIEAREFDFEFIEADSGHDGLEKCDSSKPDCVLLNCPLPDVDSQRFFEALSDDAGQIPMSVVALVEPGKKSLARKAVEAGATDYLMKDQITPILFARVVRYAIENTWAQHSLEELRTLFKTILTAIPGYLALKNRDLVYQALNPAFCQLVGRAPGEIIGHTDADLFPASDVDAYKQADIEVMRTGVMQTDDVEVTGVERKRLLQVSRSPIVDADGAIAGILWSARELPKIKEKATPEKAVVEKEEEVEEQPAREIVCDFMPSYRLTVANEALCELVGKSADELIGRSLRTMVPPEEHDKLNKLLAALNENRPEAPCQHALIVGDGAPIMFDWVYRA